MHSEPCKTLFAAMLAVCVRWCGAAAIGLPPPPVVCFATFCGANGVVLWWRGRSLFRVFFYARY